MGKRPRSVREYAPIFAAIYLVVAVLILLAALDVIP
jgi:hypothetical protein